MATNKPKLLGRKDLVDEWKKNVRRIKNAIRNMQKKGYDIPDIETFIKTPKRVTESSIRKIKKVTPSTIRKKSTFKTETGESISGSEAFFKSRTRKTYKPGVGWQKKERIKSFKEHEQNDEVFYKGKWYTLEEFSDIFEWYGGSDYDEPQEQEEAPEWYGGEEKTDVTLGELFDETPAPKEKTDKEKLKEEIEKVRKKTSDQDYREAKTALDYFQKVADLIADEFPSVKAVNYNGERLSYRDMSNEKNTLLDIWNETYGRFENDEDFTKALLSGNYLEKISEAISNVSAKNVYRWSEISQGFTALASILKLGEPLNYSDVSAVSDTITGVYDWEAEYE